MLKWNMSEKMERASVWAVWAFLAIGALGWAFKVVVHAVGMEDAPAWVQAVGSIVAIFAAWMIPFHHEQARREQVNKEIFDSAGCLALRIKSNLETLENYLERSREGDVEALIKEWSEFGEENDWSVNLQAASELPVSVFSGESISYLLAIRSTAMFGLGCAKILSEWDVKGIPDFYNNCPFREKLEYYKPLISWALENTQKCSKKG